MPEGTFSCIPLPTLLTFWMTWLQDGHMVTILELKVHWLATALSCSTSLLCFAAGTSLCAMYASMTAYDCRWSGHGLVTPPMCTQLSSFRMGNSICVCFHTHALVAVVPLSEQCSMHEQVDAPPSGV